MDESQGTGGAAGADPGERAERPGVRAQRVEALVARCLEEGGEAGVAAAARAVCAEHPELADAVRAGLARLAAVGMIAADEIPGGAPGAPGAQGTPGDAGDARGGAAPVIAGYTVLERLGAGGMAVVFAAREDATGRVVALKIAGPELALNDRARERFRREIDAARRLDHPHVVAIRDVGEARGVPYYTMDLVPGATLGALLDALRKTGIPPSELGPDDLHRAWVLRRATPAAAGVAGANRVDGAARAGHSDHADHDDHDDPAGQAGRVGPEREPAGTWGGTYVEIVARLALHVAEALAHAHAHGVVHRDVKPANVLVDAAGRARLFDLGLAHHADDPRLTRTGDFAGSPQYAAPEQVAGGAAAIDRRTDVHGLGVTLFELVALRPPFQGRSTPELLRRIQREEAPALRQVAPWAPRDLETIVACCLEKDPAQRYASARELADDLRRFLGYLPVRAQPIGAARRAARFARRNPAPTTAAALAGVILVAAPLALWLHSLRVADQRDRATAAAAEALREADENREVSHFLESLILNLDDSADPAHRGAARELIARARARLEQEGDIQPLSRASLFHTVGRVLVGLSDGGRALDAIPLFDRSLAIRAGELGETHPETVTTIAELSGLHLALGNLASARGLAERGLRAAEADAGGGGRSRALAAEALGRVELADLAEGDPDAAGALLADAAERYRALAEEARDMTAVADEARALRALARVHLRRGEVDAALERAREASALATEAWEPDLDALSDGLMLHADVHAARGEENVAAAYLTEALHVLKRRGAGRDGEIEALLERLVPLQERRLALGAAAGLARELAVELVLLGELRARSGAEGVEAAFGRALELALEPAEGGTDAGTIYADVAGRAHLGLAREHFEAELYHAAQRDVDAARALQAEAASPELWVADLHELGLRVAAARGDAARIDRAAEDARVWFEERMTAAVQPGRRLVARLRSHALLLLELDRGARAEPLLRGAEELEQRLGGPDAEPLGLALAGLAEDAFRASMQQGVTHLQSRRFEDAVRAFETCRALRPDDPIGWYNLACAHANLGRRDPAFDALVRSVELGYAYRDRAAELTAADPDLGGLRADPRFDLVLERIRSLSAAAEAYAFAPLVHVPAGLAVDAQPPLLVVLHGNGRTKRSVVEGRWREVADALGFVLLAPSGRIPAGTDPEQGMLWTDDLERYRARTWYFEKPVRDAVSELRRTLAIDPERIFLAGEDLGGTLAFHVAVRSPELYRGCVLVDATVPFDLAAEAAGSLDSLGLRVALLADVEHRPPGMPRGRSVHEHLAQTFRQLGEWGIDTTLATRAGGASGESAARLIDAVRFLETGREEATARR